MPTLVQVRTKVNDWLTARWPTVISRQETYYGNNGRYWQGLWTHMSFPSHTPGQDGDISPDNLGSHPTDQVATWLDFFSELQGIPISAAVRCDVYIGPLGPGFVLTVELSYQNLNYRRSQNYGPESWRTVAWFSYDPSIEV